MGRGPVTIERGECFVALAAVVRVSSKVIAPQDSDRDDEGDREAEWAEELGRHTASGVTERIRRHVRLGHGRLGGSYRMNVLGGDFHD